MAVLPYKDSLLLFSRYLQQLVMESLGKEFDLDGNLVCAISKKQKKIIFNYHVVFCSQSFSP
ncbi:glucose-6-phosphate isomerase 1 [Populus alba x Populus x berolinensis]|uniref:Glucose-6-phosphate isomerase 1 n=1 Tax=Populus alba x Populus x berolinensis TaxID=444605 RepID=A0AAD6QWS8_9ROSI|nr:glucose-6-phosphate isomerase 1 [Populus alba x Populus x berolinensis]